MPHSRFSSRALARGASAASPAALTRVAWWEILKRTWINSDRHDIGLLAAGVAFYAFLSFVPLLAALVISYGLIANPATIARHMRVVIDIVPADAATLIYDQITHLSKAAAERKGVALAVAVVISLYGASRAASAMIGSLNIIYEERNRRGFLRGALVAGLLATAAVAICVVGIVAASMIGFAQSLAASEGPVGAAIVQAATWLTAGALCSLGLAGMYRFAPHRENAQWRWLTLGAVCATLLWLLATLGFGLYASQFGHYNATYGSLGAVVVLLMWLYVSAYAVLPGGLINAEAERQTATDTTTGVPQPMGERGAAMADSSAAIEA